MSLPPRNSEAKVLFRSFAERGESRLRPKRRQANHPPSKKAVEQLDELFLHLRHEAYEQIREEPMRLLRELDPIIFLDRKIERIAERLVLKSLDDEFNRRRTIADKYAPLSELRSLEEFRGIEEYVGRENMEYWVKHWVLEEIAE